MHVFKAFLIFLFAVLFFEFLPANEITIVDRTADAAGLRDFLGRAFIGKKVDLAFPEDLSISIISSVELDKKTDLSSVMWVEEEFAPVMTEHSGQLTTVPFALLPVVIAVSADNPLENLSVDELKKIYSGRISNWQQLGGPMQAVRIAGAAVNGAEGRIFRHLVMNQDIFSSKSPVPGSDILPDMLICNTPGAAESLLKALPGAIVFGSWKLASAEKKSYKILKINNIAPSAENIAVRRYPLTAQHRLKFCKNKSRGNISKMVDFIKKSAQISGKSVKIE